MAATKEETALDFLKNSFGKYNIDYRENSITVSYDFIIDTGTAKVIIKIGEKRWEDSNSTSIVSYLQSKQEKIHETLLTNQDTILSMK